MSDPRAEDPALLVSGRPAPTGGADEEAWSRALDAALRPSAATWVGRGLLVEFMLAGGAAPDAGHALDDLVAPVVAALLDRHGWLGGRRQDLDFIVARKSVADRTGCTLTALRGLPALDLPPARLLHAYWSGPLPRTAGDGRFAAWAGRRGLVVERSPDDVFGVALHFGDSASDLTATESGVVAPVIDCLWPVVGGHAGHPEDARIVELVVTRSSLAGGTGVHCSVWRR